jgi:ElaB/YqjD/DUF883 family membrane-anchored ribosome-binding protein
MPGTASDLKSELSSDAQRVGDSAASRIHSELDNRKGAAASQVKSVSSAIDKAAGELGDNVPQWLRNSLQQGADQVRRFADTLEQKDSREIVDQVRTLARDNPGTFIAGCAALGFAAARIFKAGEAAPTSQELLAPPEYMSPQSNESAFRSWGSETSGSSPSGGLA